MNKDAPVIKRPKFLVVFCAFVLLQLILSVSYAREVTVDENEKQTRQLHDYLYPRPVEDNFERVWGNWPTQLPPEKVSAYLQKQVTTEWNLEQLQHALRLARFYHLSDRSAQFLDLMAELEIKNKDPYKSENVRKICALIQAVSELGSPAQKQMAVEAYWRILQLEHAKLLSAEWKRNRQEGREYEEENLELIVETFFYLPPETPREALKKKVQDIQMDCEKNGPPKLLGDYGNIHYRFINWMLEEKERKDKILGLSDDTMRTRLWMEHYLRLNLTPNLHRWDDYAGYRVMAESHVLGHDTMREIIASLLSAGMQGENKTPENEQWLQRRGYRALLFFGGALPETLSQDLVREVAPQPRPENFYEEKYDDLIRAS